MSGYKRHSLMFLLFRPFKSDMNKKVKSPQRNESLFYTGLSGSYIVSPSAVVGLTSRQGPYNGGKTADYMLDLTLLWISRGFSGHKICFNILRGLRSCRDIA